MSPMGDMGRHPVLLLLLLLHLLLLFLLLLLLLLVFVFRVVTVIMFAPRTLQGGAREHVDGLSVSGFS